MAVTKYVPGGADGMVNSTFIIPEFAYVVATCDSSKLMLIIAVVSNPVPYTLTSVPTGPWVGVIDKVWFCAFTTWVIVVAEVNMHRNSSTIVTLANPCFKPSGDFPKIASRLNINGSKTNLKLCKLLCRITEFLQLMTFLFMA